MVIGQVGTQLAQITVPVLSTSCCGIGVEVDCNGNLYYTNTYSAFLYKIDMYGTLLGTVPLTDVSSGAPISFGAISWDNNRQKFWAGTDNSGSPASVYLIDPATGMSTFQFTSPNSPIGFIDGIAYDPSDSTVWVSDDVNMGIDHFRDNGTYLGVLYPAVGSSISGVVAGNGVLFLGQDGNGQIVKVTKTTGSFISSFFTPGGRDEDLACDNINFAPKLALWSKDSYNNTITAIEVDTGTCRCGPSALGVTVTATNVLCNGQCIGTATVVPSGGLSPYTYNWSNSQTTQIATGLCAGTYSVTVIDSLGSADSAVVTITQPALLTATATATAAACSANTGTATANASGGTTGYTYLWNPSAQTTQTATGLVAGNYSITVTDANGCTQTQTVTVNSVNTLSVTATSTQSGCTVNNGTATA
ncbi:MAG: hypothetical protein HY841_14940, partial [Bacteroidetes bacterium]|nr:hypothetical protein [Bacteroidota bacterium]